MVLCANGCGPGFTSSATRDDIVAKELADITAPDKKLRESMTTRLQVAVTVKPKAKQVE